MWETVFTISAVGLGGAAGAVLRHLILAPVARALGHGAFGTFAVNLSGCFLIGLAAGLVADPGGTLRAGGLGWLLFVTGLLGSYTTVSSFSLQTLTLLQGGRTGAALANIAASLVLCLSAVAVGFALTFSMGVAA